VDLSVAETFRLHDPSDTLYAGTFGRSVWKVGL
jgi:hypothetical protein